MRLKFTYYLTLAHKRKSIYLYCDECDCLLDLFSTPLVLSAMLSKAYDKASSLYGACYVVAIADAD